MSTCAFCGLQRRTGRNFLAHRVTTLRLRTVKVCERCLEQARDAGYQIAEREPSAGSDGTNFSNLDRAS